MIALAFRSPGYPAADVSLHDGSVWVTNATEGLLGRFNKQLDQLDVALSPGPSTGADMDVLQNAGTVLLREPGAGTVRRVDVADVVLDTDPAQVPASEVVAMGGSTAAVLDATTGDLWLRPASGLSMLDTAKERPDLTVGPDAAVAVGLDGTVHAVSGRAGVVVSVPMLDQGPGPAARHELPVGDKPTITAVGGDPVVLTLDGRILAPGRGEWRLPAGSTGAVLQQPSPDAGSVLVATDRELITVPLHGGSMSTVSTEGTGDPAAPVRLGACVHAAWGARPRYLRDCGGPPERARDLSQAPPGSRFVFRVNRDVIVLNELATGGLYVFERPSENLANWDDVRPADELDEQEQVNDAPPERERNHPPVAQDDRYGARAGQAVILPVLENDGDPDGDVLVIRSVAGLDSGAGRLAVVSNGQEVQLSLAAGVLHQVKFKYTIDDGRGGTDTASVTVDVHGPTENSPPKPPKNPPRLTVESGGAGSLRALDNWRDPDGDPLTLIDASIDKPDAVRFTPDGFLTYVDAGESTGRKAITLWVSDGWGDPVEADLMVEVLEPGINVPPTANDDRVSAFVGQPVTIRPLDNDYDANASGRDNGLRLVSVSRAEAGTTITPNYPANEIAFVAAMERTFYLDYQITEGPHTAAARIRVDVAPASTANRPVAVADSAVLRGGMADMVDVLANDVDLDGDVLAVASIEVPENSGIAASVVENRWVRVSAVGDRVAGQSMSYVVSDGRSTDQGVINITSLPVGDEDQAPIASDDAATVRAGDVVSIAVLDNDIDPEGTELSVDQSIVADSPGKGVWLVHGQQVRFQAPEDAGVYTASYTVRDSAGKAATAQLTVTVVARDTEHNQPPAPQPITVRAVAGTIVRIPVPVHGIDPDGDSVRLLGPAQASRFGRVVETGPDFLRFEVYPQSRGTDELSYVVEDPFGARATGVVRIGVIEPAADNSPPTAADDVLVVSRGAKVRAPVLANDSDLDGDALSLEPLTVVNATPAGGAVAVGGKIHVTAGPDDGSVLYVQYAVSDSRGGRGIATLTVISRAGANVAPYAEDDVVTTFPAGALTVDVDVLANDDDVDAPKSELTIEPIDPAGAPASVVTPAGQLRVTLTDVPRLVGYRIVDAAGATATAFVRVPAAGNQPPAPRPGAARIEVAAGQTLTLNLADYATDPDGDPVTITAAARVTASPTPGLSVVPGSVTAGTLDLRADPAFTGPAAVVIEVTDGRPEHAPVALALPVTVNPSSGVALNFACPVVELRAGASPTTVDLSTCVRGIEPRLLSFEQAKGQLAGVTAFVSGHQLQASAARDAQPGTRGTLILPVRAAGIGRFEGRLDVVVRAAPLIVTGIDALDSVPAGREVRIDVTANDINPFPDTPLKLTGQLRRDAGDVTARVDGDGRTLIIKPSRDFYGTARITYTVVDALGTPDRVVPGQVVIRVVGRPDRPSKPVVRSVGAGRVVLAWGEPDGRGSAVTVYEVVDESGSVKKQCASTVCAIDGLKNGDFYRFRVRARNVVDWSEFSQYSAPVRPDVKPAAPAPPTTKFGDGSVTVRWVRPASDGSPIASYEIEISPPVGASKRVSAASTSLVWEGLTNGTGYTFRVRATNESGLVGDWSGYSATEVPAGVPATPDAPTAVPVADGIGEQISVQWDPPFNNGASITNYRIAVVRAGVTERTITVAGDTLSTTIGVENGVNYEFRVSATNKAGSSPLSAPSPAVFAHGRPDRVTSFTVRAADGDGNGYDGRVAYTLSAPDDHGLAISKYEFDRDGNGSVDFSAGPATSGYVTGLTNGTSYVLRVRACNDMCGDWSANSPPVTPYGPPLAPGASAARSGTQQIRLSWSAPPANGRPLDRLEIRIDGGTWEQVAVGSGSRTVGNGYSQTHSIDVRAVDDLGKVGPVASASATTQPPPARKVSVWRGDKMQQPGGANPCTHSSCGYIVIRLENFAPNTTYSVKLEATNNDWNTFNVTTNGDGFYQAQTSKYYGYPGTSVWATVGGVRSDNYTWPSS